MNDVLLDLLPLMLAAALVPLYPILVLLVLLSRGGLRTAIAFVAGLRPCAWRRACCSAGCSALPLDMLLDLQAKLDENEARLQVHTQLTNN